LSKNLVPCITQEQTRRKMKQTFKEPSSYWQRANRSTRVFLVVCPDNKFFIGLTKGRMKESVSNSLKNKENKLSLHCLKKEFELKDLTISQIKNFGSRLRASLFKETFINQNKKNKNLLNKI